MGWAYQRFIVASKPVELRSLVLFVRRPKALLSSQAGASQDSPFQLSCPGWKSIVSYHSIYHTFKLRQNEWQDNDSRGDHLLAPAHHCPHFFQPHPCARSRLASACAALCHSKFYSEHPPSCLRHFSCSGCSRSWWTRRGGSAGLASIGE